MATTGFGLTPVPNPADRQYPLAIYYHFGNNPTDASGGTQFFLPPGAQITGGAITVPVAGSGTITIDDNQASPVAIFSAASLATAGQVAISATPYYPSGAIITVPANANTFLIRIEYVVDGRANEVANGTPTE